MSKQLTPEQRDVFEHFMQDFEFLFSDVPGCTNLYEPEIVLTDPTART